MKKCTKCGRTKPFDQFYKRKMSIDGLSHKCKACGKVYAQSYRKANQKKINSKHVLWRESSRDSQIEKEAEYRENNRAKIRSDHARWTGENRDHVNARKKEWREKNPEKRKQSQKKWADNNKDKLAAKEREYRATTKGKVTYFMRNTLQRVLHSREDKRSYDLLNYNWSDLRGHLEQQFKQGMNWQNYGEWQIDHIKPIAAFISEGIKDPAIINALSNLQPLWAAENRKKGARYG